MSENTLIQLRRAFKIPDSVLIVTGEELHLGKSSIGKQPGANKYSIPQGQTPDAPVATSVLNTPVYTNIRFLPKTYTDNTGKTVTTDDLTYNAVLISVSQSKKIIKTEIQGRDGTVKEYIGMDDYHVQVNGILTGANGVHPVGDKAKLKKMLDAPVPIAVVSSYLQALGIHEVVVEEYTLAQEAGGYSYQTFSISFVSDIPQQLRLNGI